MCWDGSVPDMRKKNEEQGVSEDSVFILAVPNSLLTQLIL